ncbi:MAG: hypothetical protein ACYCOR_13750 [Acidobacteriaceae bacterium]
MMHAKSYQSIPAAISAREEAQIAFDEAVMDAYDIALAAAELAVRAQVAATFRQSLAEIDEIIDFQLAERRIRARDSYSRMAPSQMLPESAP